MTIRQVENPAHIITMGIIDQGWTNWAFRCLHPEDEEQWWTRREDGEVHGKECWLLSWWEGCGQELLEMNVTPPLTLAVRPEGHWDFEDGGTLIWDTEES